MLVLSLANNDLTNINKVLELIDCIEYRLDLMTSFAFKRLGKPVIFTLRHQTHGGGYLASIDELCQDVLAYCQHSPDFIDLDLRLPKALFTSIRQAYPHIKIIASYHQYVCDIDKLKSHLDAEVDADFFKFAMICDKAIDVLHLFQLRANRPLSLIPMGDKASFGRVLGKIMGNSFDYVATDTSQLTASGQLCLHDMHDIYHYQYLNRDTKIFALLAMPVTHSVGHLFHNQFFQEAQRNAVYVKIEQDKTGLAQLLLLMLEFPFEGLSLSMPLKQSVFPNQIINTLVRQDDRWIGYNTDGQAVINLLGLERGMTLLIIGHGGAAKGIEQACIQYGISVVFIAREGGGYRFEDDIPVAHAIINTLPNQAYVERPWFNDKLSSLICKAQRRLDIIYHEVTVFQDLCCKQQLPFITGIEMFEAQGQLQQDLWKKATCISTCIS